ncbi:hypothetical protein [Streptomyces sp. NPDC050856]|uniref:hypothetical protein n=1 Tax=Streptomyces sp. NPDC050856 TaxID=3154939 RepID=UPI0033FFD909
MHTTRTGIACALCHTPTTELVYLVLSAQWSFPQREVVQDRWCPAGCHQLHPVEWKEAMPLLPGDDA